VAMEEEKKSSKSKDKSSDSKFNFNISEYDGSQELVCPVKYGISEL